MKITLKIMEERKTAQVRKVDGYSGKLYPFTWSDTLRAYTYVPKTQQEIDDLMRRSDRATRFAPVFVAPQAAPAPSAEETGQLSVLGKLLALAGLETRPSDTVETAQRILRAYDKGREDERMQTVEPQTAPVLQPVDPLAGQAPMPIVEVPLREAIPSAPAPRASRARDRRQGAHNATS